MAKKPQIGMRMYAADGSRKYLTAEEREAVLRAAEKAPREVRTFSGVLAFGGCRISEAPALSADRVDLSAGVVVFESLKKRRKEIYRAVPLPPHLLDALWTLFMESAKRKANPIRVEALGSGPGVE